MKKDENIFYVSFLKFLGLAGVAVFGYFANIIFSNWKIGINVFSYFYYEGIKSFNIPHVVWFLFLLFVLGFNAIASLQFGYHLKELGAYKGKIAFVFTGMIIFSLLFVITILYSIIVIPAGKTIDNNITIIAPYISEQKEEEMRSGLLQVSNADELDKLKNEITQIAKEHNLQLQ
ncbi:MULTISPECIES: hypothetical protein [Listeria]|uniref:hypothetical protein n=1 Tax=Listeria TaxID=1637 RepID=UPI000B58859E|nr:MULTISPECIES: hypothetical protein [Listeria]